MLPPIETTQAQARTLFKVYDRVLRAWRVGLTDVLAVYRRSLAALTMDDTVSLEAVLERLFNEIAVALLVEVRDGFSLWAIDLSAWHMRKFTSNLRYATAIDLATLLPSFEAGAGGQSDTVALAIARNTLLIRNVSDQIRQQVGDIVLRGLQSRTPVREVAREIVKVTGLQRARALRIASDQTVKLSAALDRQRMDAVGISEFIWKHSRKAHPREWHKARDGQRFKFTDPKLRGDLPGDQPFCGCKAQGVIDGAP